MFARSGQLVGVVAWFVTMALAGCQSVDGPPRLPAVPALTGAATTAATADREPRPEPHSRAGNHSPYQVFGRTYEVLPSAAGFVEQGVASWYGRKFHGRPTSNGERFDMHAISAAHKHLPLPTWVRVTNLDNGRTLEVRVNDRGPFHGDRVIDLSYAAAQALGYADQGVARVRIEAIDFAAAEPTLPASSEPRPGTPAVAPEPGVVVAAASAAAERIYLQAGAFRDHDSARLLAAAIDDLVGHEAAVEMITHADDLVRVRLGPFPDAFAAERLQAMLMTADVARPLLVRERDIESATPDAAPICAAADAFC